MFQERSAAEKFACAAVCAGALLGLARLVLAEPASVAKPIAAYSEGKAITFTPASGRHKRMLVVGDAVLGPLLPDRKPNDHRPNLYVVSPGEQYRAQSAELASLEFNLVVSGLTRAGEPAAWDVYWSLVLDPALKADLRSENALLFATQDSFSPGDSLAFDDVPANGVLRAYLHISSIAGLQQFRREDGSLPRLVIVPANIAVRATAVDPDAPTACPPVQGTLSRAISVFSHRCRESGAAEKSTHTAK